MEKHLLGRHPSQLCALLFLPCIGCSYINFILQTGAGRSYAVFQEPVGNSTIKEKCKALNTQEAVLPNNGAFMDWNHAMIAFHSYFEIWFITQKEANNVTGPNPLSSGVAGDKYWWREEKIDGDLYGPWTPECSGDDFVCHIGKWDPYQGAFKLHKVCCTASHGYMCDMTDYCANDPCHNRQCVPEGGSYTCSLLTPTAIVHHQTVYAGADVNLTCVVVLPNGTDVSGGWDSFRWFLDGNQLKEENQVAVTDSLTTLTAVGAANEGNYSCQYVSGEETSRVSQDSKLVVKPPVRPVMLSSPRVAWAGYNFRLPCIFLNVYQVSVTYTLVTPNLQMENSDGAFVIHFASVSDAGEYRCKVTISNTTSELSDALWVFLKPNSPSLSSSVEEIEGGGSTALRCSNNDTEPPVKTYVFSLKNGSVIYEGQENLIINNFSLSKADQYFCKVHIPNVPVNTFQISSGKSNFVTLSYRWSAITLSASHTEIKPEDTVNLRCSSSEPPPLQYVFYRNGSPVDLFNSSTGDSNNFTDSQVLDIQNFTAIDEGRYHCRKYTEGKLSPKSNSVKLTLLKKPILSSTATTVPETSMVELSCWIPSKSEETQSYAWSKDRVIFSTTTKKTVRLKSFGKKDRGTYRCRPNLITPPHQQQLWSDGVPLTLVSKFHTCKCQCSNQTVRVNITKESVKQMVSTLTKHLKVESHNLSATERKKISVVDSNAYSNSVGFAASFLLAVVFGSIILSDAIYLIDFFSKPKNSVGVEAT